LSLLVTVYLMFAHESCVDKPRTVNVAGIDFQVLNLVETNTESPEQDITTPHRLADSMRALRPAAGIFAQGNRDIGIGTGGDAGLGCDNRATLYLIDKTLRGLCDGDSENLLFD